MRSTTNSGQTRSVEERVSYAVGHRIRIEVLAILNEGPRSPSEIARLIGQGASKVNNHVQELLKAGCIELARVEKVRNTNEHFFRAVEIPFLSDEETRALPDDERREITGLILQATMAEALASFWAGKMLTDDDIWLSWRWFNLDAQGRREVADVQAEAWSRIVEIEGDSAARRAESGEEAASIVVAQMGFERHRSVGTDSAPAWPKAKNE